MQKIAVQAARKAGALIAERFPTRRSVTKKGMRDIVTETDVAAESLIIDLIHRHFPGHAILSEEAGSQNAQPGVQVTWIIDPLDGTTNYAHRIPFCCVSIGVFAQGQPIVGVVYDPLHDQLFAAERGKGATLNGRPLHVRSETPLEQAVIGLDWGHVDEERQRTIALLTQFIFRCRTVRALGSAALAQAYVAAGWLDGYLNLIAKPWDMAAGMLLVTEAGGRHTVLNHQDRSVGRMLGCLATNGAIHDRLLMMEGT